MPRRTKKSRGPYGLNPTGSRPFWILWSVLAICTCCIWSNSSYRFHLIDFKFGLCELNYLVIKSYQKIAQILKYTFAAEGRVLTSRHKTRNCYNFGIKGPICTKLHRMDNSPALNTSTCKKFEIVIAPPAGDRKWHVLDSEVLLWACWLYLTQIWSERP